MTYLSRVRINPFRTASREWLDNPRKLHGAVLGCFPDIADDERILWRLDADNPRRPMLYTLSQSKPSWIAVVEQGGWPGADGEHAEVRDYAPLLAQLAVGREYAFRLTANPVQNTSAPDKLTEIQQRQLEQAKDGKLRRSFRIGHRTVAAQTRWFLERTASWGFEVPIARIDPLAPGEPPPDGELPREVRITARERVSFRKKRDNPPVVLHTATFEGRLRITDVQAFTARLLGGIGPGKAYGCGLLTLAPLRGIGRA